MDDPNVVADLQCIDHAKGIASVAQRQLQHARAKPAQRFGDHRMRPLGNGSQNIEQIVAGSGRESLKIFPCCFDPTDRTGVSEHASVVPNLSLDVNVDDTRQPLEDTYPNMPIFGGPEARVHAHFVNAWADSVLIGGIARLIIHDIFDVIDAKDQDYCRTIREAWLGATLEAVYASRDAQLAAFQDSLSPTRVVLRRHAFLSGTAPNYADHILAGTLMWPPCSSRFSSLAEDDPVAVWFDKMLDAYDGPGRGAKTC